MATVGLRELRQQASELVRLAESGEVTTITVNGRPAARLVPASPRSWRRFEEISSLFTGPGDPRWDADRALIDGGLRDPWS